PSFLSSDSVWFIFSWLRPVMAIFAPCLPKTLAQDSPIPEVPPVIKTTLLCMLMCVLCLKPKYNDFDSVRPNFYFPRGRWINTGNFNKIRNFAAYVEKIKEPGLGKPEGRKNSRRREKRGTL